jgi:hypothetical protein
VQDLIDLSVSDARVGVDAMVRATTAVEPIVAIAAMSSVT